MASQQAQFSDSDEVDESHVEPEVDEGDTLGDELDGLEGDDDLEDEDALASPGEPTTSLPNLDPPPPYLREISSLASWTVSSSKPGCSIPQLRHPSPSLFWQSDGPQPHYLNIHFNKLVRIVGLRLYLDFEQDESYTPTRIIFLAGSGMNDLQEWGEMRLESPRGWVWADFSGVGDAGSDSDENDDDDEVDDEEPTEQQSIIDDPQPQHHRPLDSENSAPTFTPTHPDTTGIPSDTDVDEDDDEDDDQDVEDSMHMDPRPLPRSHQRQHLHTPIHHHHQHSTPSFPRPTPRLPFAALSPNMPNAAARPPVSPRRPRMPVLRAHLVQVKILENHQNGKDTHLRGLQVFTRTDEGTRGTEAVVLRRGGGGGEAGAAAGGKKSRSKRDDVFELGGGLSASTWDMEPSIR